MDARTIRPHAARLFRPRLPGQGDLPLDLFLLALAESVFDGVITVELAPDALDAGDDEAIRAHLRDTVAFCRACLA